MLFSRIDSMSLQKVVDAISYIEQQFDSEALRIPTSTNN